MKKLSLLVTAALLLTLTVTIQGVSAEPAVLYVDANGVCGGNLPCYPHPQDAVNAANPGDTIRVYPGTYGHRQYTSPIPPHWGPGDQYAPALIVWKDGLTIEAVDPDPANTVIQTTYNFWVNMYSPGGGGGGSIEHSTGCTWNAVTKVWEGNCVRPTFGTAPNAVAIIASNVTLRGFTFHRPFDFTDGTYNTAGVMIGGLYAGDPDHLGADNNTVENCAFSNVWHAVYIWHSSGNRIVNNTVAELNTNHWAAISTYDGYNDVQINYGHLSQNNLIANNVLANKGIALGAWAPPTWTSNAGSQVCCNTTTSVGVTYAHGPVLLGCNTGGFWSYNADNVVRITGITYTGDVLAQVGPVNLSAQLAYDGPHDGSGFQVEFQVGDSAYTAVTAAGGSAGLTISLPVGVYEVKAKISVCENCEFSDTQFLAVYDPVGSFVTGGGWIWSPPGAYAANLALEGKATFGFVSKYKKGASVPDGNTEFQFQTAGLSFKSTAYDWLVVAGARAQFKGSGTINGLGDYGFMLTAIDGQVNGGGGVDRFRIKIWDKSTGQVVYDNQMGAGDAEEPTTALGGGSIVIHK
jgi:parallel beta-helix repeat protein